MIKLASALAKPKSSKSKDNDHEFSYNFALLQLKLHCEELIIDINRLAKSVLQQTPHAHKTLDQRSLMFSVVMIWVQSLKPWHVNVLNPRSSSSSQTFSCAWHSLSRDSSLPTIISELSTSCVTSLTWHSWPDRSIDTARYSWKCQRNSSKVPLRYHQWSLAFVHFIWGTASLSLRLARC